ncbi:MAG: DUF2142 domain-containing protein [Ruminococcaceae bacterium]|nr:DUF2142 domain-containing protein [Oscillospiraceae bacterium]
MKIINLLNKFRHFIAIGCILCFCAVCFAWVGYDTVRESVGLGHREIVNDDYSVITETVTEEGVSQPITVKAGTDFYGVNLNMHIYNRVCHGTLHTQLLDENGNVLSTASDDLTTVKDNTFKRFIFGGVNYKAEEDKNYTVRVFTQYETEEDRLALWKSETTAEGFDNIVENGKEYEGTLALQYITKYVTAGMWKYYLVLAVLLTVFLVGLYLLIFVRKAKITTVFVVFCLAMGFVFSIYTPLKGSPDEYVHITTAYHKSNELLGIENSYNYSEGTLLMRECDAGVYTEPAKYNAFEIQQIYEGITEKAEKTQLVPVKARIHDTAFGPLFWAQALGVTVARLLGLGFVPMIILGRLANLAVYTAIVYLAIKTMPIYKTTLAVLALTSVPLQLAGSFTYDTLVIALCFVFTAVVFSCAYEKEKITFKDIVLLAVLAALIAPCKIVYITIIALCFIIPVDKFSNRKTAFVSFAVIIAFAAVMWIVSNANTVLTMVGLEPLPQQQVQTVTVQNTAGAEENTVSGETAAQTAVTEQVQYDIYSDIAPNGDNRNLFGVSYILSHIPQTVKLVFNTIQESGVLYIQQIFGGILGEVIVSPVKINWIYTIAVMFVVFLSTVKTQGETLVYKGVRKWWAMLLAVAACGLFCLACITWTPINYTTIFGIQGRYFLPVMPLIVMFFANDNISVKKNIDRSLLYALAVINVLILLDGFTIMAVNTSMIYK